MKFKIGLTCSIMVLFLSTTAMAANKISTPVQYNLETSGSATTLSSDDYLLDGNFKNGELVNGSIYYSEEEAQAGVQKEMAMERVTPNTGVFKGIDSDGNFSYTIHSKGTTSTAYTVKSNKTWVGTKSKIFRDINSGSYLTSSDYSYIVSLMKDGTAVGSFRAYPDGINGGASFTTDSYSSYYIKIAVESFPLNWYLNGTGSLDKK